MEASHSDPGCRYFSQVFQCQSHPIVTLTLQFHLSLTPLENAWKTQTYILTAKWLVMKMHREVDIGHRGLLLRILAGLEWDTKVRGAWDHH